MNTICADTQYVLNNLHFDSEVHLFDEDSIYIKLDKSFYFLIDMYMADNGNGMLEEYKLTMYEIKINRPSSRIVNLYDP